MPITPYLGTIVPFAGSFAPKGWAFCAGQLLAINQNQALFALLGLQFGGNGQTTFGLPDLRGRCAVGYGSGPDRTTRQIGDRFGNETVTLLGNQIPPHTHTINALPVEGTVSSPANALLAKSSADVRRYAAAASLVTMSPAALGPGGSSQPHSNMQPFLVINYIIALQGVFPPRP